jgi:intracellular sulfur oxidation DsrE/DsrF family protein
MTLGNLVLLLWHLESMWGPQLCLLPLPNTRESNELESKWGPNCVPYSERTLGNLAVNLKDTKESHFASVAHGVDVGAPTVSITLMDNRESFFASLAHGVDVGAPTVSITLMDIRESYFASLAHTVDMGAPTVPITLTDAR